MGLAPSEPSCEHVSGKTDWTTSCAASRSPELRGGLRRNWPDRLWRGVLEPRVARMDQANLAGVPRAHHLCARSCGDASGHIGQATSGATCLSPELRRCLRRKWARSPQVRSISEPRIARMSQASWTGQPHASQFRAQSCEDVSGDMGQITSGHNSSRPEVARMTQPRPPRRVPFWPRARR